MYCQKILFLQFVSDLCVQKYVGCNKLKMRLSSIVSQPKKIVVVVVAVIVVVVFAVVGLVVVGGVAEN